MGMFYVGAEVVREIFSSQSMRLILEVTIALEKNVLIYPLDGHEAIVKNALSLPPQVLVVHLQKFWRAPSFSTPEGLVGSHMGQHGVQRRLGSNRKPEFSGLKERLY